MSDLTSSGDRLEALFSAVIRLNANQRDSYLDQECADDPSLRGLVETLIRAHEDVTGILDRSAGDAIGSALSVPVAFVEGDRVGAYRIIRQLGTGGMGDVYLAQRDDDQYRRNVAIKVLRHGLLSTEMLARFRSERQILALLDHPNIAKMYDGGVTDTGIPYVVMEYVEGDTINHYCDKYALPVRDRLRLFLDVCYAVRHAHRNLVVHRDLKPGNILVTADRRVKLLDFGIAKLLDDHMVDTDDQVHTREDARVMTPDYASPEQLFGKPVTVASDVYSLGVLLHELLTGVRPHRFAGMTRLEIEKRLETTSISRPSTLVDQEFVSKTSIEITEWKKWLHGDLDSIILAALRTEVDQRYPSADKLAADIDHYLNDQPVTARNDEFSYRLSKFLKRNRFTVVVTSLMVAMVLTFLVVTLINNIEIRRQSEQILYEQEKAREVADFLSGLFSELNPNQAQGTDISARELLDQGAAQISTKLAGQPDMEAELLQVVGTVYFNVNDYTRAEELLGLAYTIRDSLYGPYHIDTAESMYWVARMHAELAQYAKADSLLKLVAENYNSIDHASARWKQARASGDRGLIMRLMGNYADAEPFFTDAIDIIREELGAKHPEHVRMLNNYATLLNAQARYEEADVILTEILAINREIHGELHTDVLRGISNLATNKNFIKKPAEADSLLIIAQGMALLLLGEDHNVYQTILNNRASFMLQGGKTDSAEVMYRKVIELRTKSTGPDHPIIGFSTLGLANTLNALGRYEEAQLYTQMTIDNWAKSMPAGSWFVSAASIIHGESLIGAGKVTEGEAIIEEHFEIVREARGDSDQFVRKGAKLLQEKYTRDGDQARAQVYATILNGEN